MRAALSGCKPSFSDRVFPLLLYFLAATSFTPDCTVFANGEPDAANAFAKMSDAMQQASDGLESSHYKAHNAIIELLRVMGPNMLRWSNDNLHLTTEADNGCAAYTRGSNSAITFGVDMMHVHVWNYSPQIPELIEPLCV